MNFARGPSTCNVYGSRSAQHLRGNKHPRWATRSAFDVTRRLPDPKVIAWPRFEGASKGDTIEAIQILQVLASCVEASRTMLPWGWRALLCLGQRSGRCWLEGVARTRLGGGILIRPEFHRSGVWIWMARGLSAVRYFYRQEYPPSTGSVWPVMNEAASLARNTTAVAISSG